MNTVQDVLLQQIPINKIRVNGNNPRKVISPEMIDTTAASMKAIGQETPIKVRKTSSQSTGDSSQENQPKTEDNGYEFELIGGHIRLEAAKKLGWNTLNALVLDLSTDEAELAAIMDNQGKDMHWLDWYQAIERRIQFHPALYQQDIAEQFGIPQQEVSRAVKTMAFLDQASRETIYTNCVRSGDVYQISASTALRLSDLEDSQKVAKALKVVIDKKMTEAEAKKLVEWVKSGHEPESFGQPQSAQAEQSSNQGHPEDPMADLWRPLPKNIKVFLTADGYQLRAHLAQSEVGAGVYGLMANIEQLKGQAQEPEDPQYRNAIPQIIEEGVKARAEEKTAQAKRDAEEEADFQAKSKAIQEEKDKEAQAKMAEARNQLDSHQFEWKQKMETDFGIGVFTATLLSKCFAGDKTNATKQLKSFLPHSGKTQEEQDKVLQDFQGDMKEQIQLMKKAGLLENPPKSKSSGNSEGTEDQSKLTPDEVQKIQNNSRGYLDTVAKGLGLKEGVDASEITKTIENNLFKDGKSAINTVIKQGMRKVIKGLI